MCVYIYIYAFIIIIIIIIIILLLLLIITYPYKTQSPHHLLAARGRQEALRQGGEHAARLAMLRLKYCLGATYFQTGSYFHTSSPCFA